MASLFHTEPHSISSRELASDAIDLLESHVADELATWLRQDGDPTNEVFVARQPEHAIRWMCQYTSRRALKRFVDQVYKDNSAAAPDESDREGSEDEDTRPTKRKRGGGNSGAGQDERSKRVKENTLLKFAEIMSNTQDNLEDEMAGLTLEHMPYVRHLSNHNGLGWSNALKMIKRARQVGGREAFEDFSKAMQLWRDRKSANRSVWAPATQIPLNARFAPPGFRDVAARIQRLPDAITPGRKRARGNGDARENPLFLSDNEDEEEEEEEEEEDDDDNVDNDDDNGDEFMDALERADDDAALDFVTNGGAEERDEENEDNNEDNDEDNDSTIKVLKDELSSLYFSALRNEGREVIDKYRHRWVLALIHKHAENLRLNLKKQKLKPGRRGKRISSVARDQVFSMLYPDNDTVSEREQSSRQNQFNRLMTFGKRWFLLQKNFGLGVFVMVPANAFPNNFIERTLSLEHLKFWIGMLLKCRPELSDRCSQLETTVMHLFRDHEPEEQRFRLEYIYDWTGREQTGFDDVLDLVPAPSPEL